VAIEIGVNFERGRNKSSKEQFLNNSAASSELNKALSCFWSAVESSGIKGAI
jgi:hypothetical protein